MDTSKHTVTIPIADYNELLKCQEFSGSVEQGEQSDTFKAVYSIAQSKSPTHLSVEEFKKKFKIYLKLI